MGQLKEGSGNLHSDEDIENQSREGLKFPKNDVSKINK
jgi:hypothetical protein